MDPSLVVSVVLFIASCLLAINAFFLRNLVTKIEATSTSAASNHIRVESIQRQIEDISHMREDVAVLKFAILGHLKTVDSQGKKT